MAHALGWSVGRGTWSPGSQSTRGPSWGHPMVVLGTIRSLLEPFCGHPSPKIDKAYEELTLTYPHEGPCVGTIQGRGRFRAKMAQLEGFQGFDLKARVRIWPALTDVCHIRSFHGAGSRVDPAPCCRTSRRSQRQSAPRRATRCPPHRTGDSPPATPTLCQARKCSSCTRSTCVSEMRRVEYRTRT